MANQGEKRYWLFKQEPNAYSYLDLERDGRTVWDGVSNALAQKHLAEVRVGDHVLFYHTGKEKAVVGEMVVVGGPQPAADGDEKNVVVEVEPVRRLTPVALGSIKADPLLSGWDLIRLPRLSVVPTTLEQWKRILELSGEGGAGEQG